MPGPLCVEKIEPRIVDARDWTGENDIDNPRNWSLAEKVLSTLAFTGLAFASTFAASAISPGLSQVTDEFHVFSDEVGVLPISLFNLGLAFGPLIGSPLSETAGRKAVVMVTTPLFALFTLGAGFSPTMAGLIACRFFAGVVAAPAISNASATITDYTVGRNRGNALTFYYAIPTTGAVLGPLVGGLVADAKGWRWTQWTTIFIIVAFYIPVIFTRETYKKTILQRRAKAMNIEGPPTTDRALAGSVRYFATILFLRPINMLISEPIVTLVCLYSGFLFGMMYTFVVASPWVYAHYYNFDLTGQSLSFLSLIVGALSAPVVLTFLNTLVYRGKLGRHFEAPASGPTALPPEHRLVPALIASPLLPVFLLIFAWTTRPTIHWICPVFFQGASMCVSSMIYTTTNMYMMEVYGPLYGASAAGAAMLSRYTLSTIFPLFSLQMYRALGVGWATSILALVTLLLAPVPWTFYRFGERIREKIRFEISA